MKLEKDYLETRHEYWRRRIGEAGIWDPDRFQDIEIIIRKNHRRYNAVFQRRITYTREARKKLSDCWNNRKITDRIVVYNKVEDFEPRFLDSILVHEMIHQYTVQNDIKDSSVHGRVFRKYMEAINSKFAGEITIRIRDINPGLPIKGEGDTVHSILMVHFNNDTFMCAVVMKNKTEEIEKLIKRNKKRWNVRKYERGESNDVFFSRFVRCKSSLHGMIKPEAEFQAIKAAYHIRILS